MTLSTKLAFLIVLVSAQWCSATVGVTEVTPHNAKQLSDKVRVAVSHSQGRHTFTVFVSGKVDSQTAVSAVLRVGSGPGPASLEVPIMTKVAKSQDGGKSPIRYVELKADRTVISTAVIEVLLDNSKANSGEIYRIHLKDFAPEPPATRPGSTATDGR